MGQDYFVGLDMGTSSVGWAVTDTTYKLLRKKGKDLWGVHLFPEAKTAADRRSHRTARRRLQRERARIGLLRELFQSEIDKVDSAFYQRLADSKFFAEDKEEHQKNALFNDKDFTDADYYKRYPTISHLRLELINSKEEHDIRLVFLAILNIFKHRGHFLNENLGETSIEKIDKLLEVLNTDYAEVYEDDFCDAANADKISAILTSRDYSASKKCELLAEACGIDKKKEKSKYEMLKTVCGLSGKLLGMFPRETEESEDIDPEIKNMGISFKAADYEEKLSKIELFLQEEEYAVLLDLKQLCDWATLANLMEGGKVRYLSEARVKSYEKHKADLQLLKKVYKELAPELYDDMFRVMKTGNYSAYVGSVNSHVEFLRRDKNNKTNPNRTDGLMKRIHDEVMAMEITDDTRYILDEIDKKTFLPKQLTADNGSIPYQLHSSELKAILANAEAYLPFLKEADESGLSVSERIVQLFEFRIPYFVGPLRHTQNGTGWSVDTGKGKITPWNIRERIDFRKSEEEFILRMINHCTYLADEQVIPKESLLYQKYCVLNELNNLKINFERIDVELKQQIYTDLFKKGKKVTGKALKAYLVKEGIVSAKEEVNLSGFDIDFKSTLSSYKKFTEVFATDSLTYEQEKMAEQIILWGTIHSGEKKRIKEIITDAYGAVLSKEQIERISGYRFKDWGNFSKEFLQLPGNTEGQTIIERLWNTNENLMELLHGSYGFEEALKEKTVERERSLKTVTFADLDGLWLSNPVKRMVWKALCILKEIEEVMGCEPKKLFVEMTRGGDEEKKRTVSRQKRLEELYKNCQKEVPELFAGIQQESDASLRSKKLYLYYMQKGRCMYSGEIIDLHKLTNSNAYYDIDHIYPRHFVKDDSLENNLVLVKKNINNRKQDTYPIEESIRSQMIGMWRSLFVQGFISKEKFARLTRNTPFTEEERVKFINRQLVETSQATKAVAALMEELFSETKVVYVKARTVSQFRQKFDLIKVREINDLHHANDAYLNIVVGNTYNVKFTNNPINFVRDYERDPDNHKYHMDKLFDYDVVRNEEVAWRTGEEKSIGIVRKMMGKGTPLVTYMNFEAKEGITRKDTIYSSKIANKDAYIPVSTSDARLADVTKYGGRTDISGTYFFLVEYTDKKGKRVRSFEPMYLYLKNSLKTKADLEKYCEEVLHYQAPSVRLEKIKMYSKIRINGYEVLITGRTGYQLLVLNTMQLLLPKEETLYIKAISKAVSGKYNEEQLIHADITKEKNEKLYLLLQRKHSHGLFRNKPNPIDKKLIVHQQDFSLLNMLEQCRVLVEIVKATGKDNIGANLELFGESKSSGKMAINKVISGWNECSLINQSPTGLFEYKIDLLTV